MVVDFFKKYILKLLIIVLIGVIISTFGVYVNNKFFTSNKEVKVHKKEKVEKKEPKNYNASIVMVGDSLIHESVYLDAKENDTYNFKPMLEDIKPISSNYDLAYYNQETILGGSELGLSNYPRFNSPYEVGDAFIDAGFNMVSLATNHTMDKGEQGVLNSVNYWNSKDVAASGQWSSFDDRSNSIKKVYEVNNIKYAFISYTMHTNGLETPAGKEYLNNVYTPEKAKEDIESVRDKVDVVIVAMHWGVEYSFRVDQKQEEVANYLSSLGVQLIIGAHPHVVQPVEYINDNKTLVIYSLGNFISDQNDVDNFTGLMMEATISKTVNVDKSVDVKIIKPKAELIYTTCDNVRGVNKNFKVKVYPKLTYDDLHNRDYLYDHYKSIVSERYPELPWGLTNE